LYNITYLKNLSIQNTLKEKGILGVSIDSNWTMVNNNNHILHPLQYISKITLSRSIVIINLLFECYWIIKL
jgi:hypothetical protein